MARTGLRRFAIDDGQFSFSVPANWPVNQTELNVFTFRLGRREWALGQIEFQAIEVPDDIAADRIGQYIAGRDSPDDWDLRREGLESRVFSDRYISDGGNAHILRHRAMTIGPYLRHATFLLQMPPDRADSKAGRAALAEFEAVVAGAAFAPQILPADRIAPSHSLKQTSVYDAFRFRVPVDWQRHPNEGSGWTRFEPENAAGDPMAPRLRAQHRFWRVEDEDEAAGDARAAALELAYAWSPDLRSLAPGTWRVERGPAQGDHGPVSRTVLRRLDAGNDAALLAIFELDIPAARSGEPDMVRLETLICDEVQAALLTPTERVRR